MGSWEERSIWNNNPYARHIIFYGRYINDVLLISDGGMNVFLAFVIHCNNNDLGLSFIHIIDSDHLLFLNPKLTHENGSIVAKNHSKLVGGNSYLHYASCHHPG